MSMEESYDEPYGSEEQPQPWRFTITHAVSLLGLFLVLTFTFGLLLFRSGLDPASITWRHVAIVNGLSGLATILVGRTLTGYSISDALGFHQIRIAPLISALLLISGVVLLSSELNNLLQWILPLPDVGASAESQFKGSFATFMFTVAFVAPVTEELIFRGLILDGLRENYLLSTAILLSSLFFAVIHIDLYSVVNAFILGIALAFVRIRTGSLLLCVILHALANAFPYVLSRLFSVTIPGLNAPSTDAQMFQPLWLDALGVLLASAGSFMMRRSTRIRNL